MRINFNGTYKEINTLLNSSNKPRENTPGQFEGLLGSISPDKPIAPQMAETKAVLEPALAPPEQLDESAMASYRFAPPPLSTPELKPIEPQIIFREPVNESAEGVKTPSGVKAIRTPHDREFSAMRRSERMAAVGKMVETAGKKYGVDPVLSMSVVSNESSFDSNAISTDGHRSKGLFQLLDSTGSDFLQRAGADKTYNPFDPKLNVDLGVSYLRYLHDIFSQSTTLPNQSKTVAAANSSSLEKLAVAAFNAGEGRVASAQERAEKEGNNPSDYDQIAAYLPDTTQEYVDRVMRSKSSFESYFAG